MGLLPLEKPKAHTKAGPGRELSAGRGRAGPWSPSPHNREPSTFADHAPRPSSVVVSGASVSGWELPSKPEIGKCILCFPGGEVVPSSQMSEA